MCSLNVVFAAMHRTTNAGDKFNAISPGEVASRASALGSRIKQGICGPLLAVTSAFRSLQFRMPMHPANVPEQPFRNRFRKFGAVTLEDS